MQTRQIIILKIA